MSSPIILPFNFDPVNIVRGTTALYTVPAGRYAKVTIDYNLYFNASANSEGASVSTAIGLAVANSIEIMLSAGNTIQMTSISTSQTISSNSGNPSVSFRTNFTAGFNLNINGVLWKPVLIQNFISAATGSTTSFSTSTVTVSGVAQFGYVAQEYNKLS